MCIIKEESRQLTGAVTQERVKMSALLEDFNGIIGLFRKKTRVLTAILLTTVILTACDPGKSPGIYEQATETFLPSSTPAETATSTPSPSPTETPIPTETATPRPTITPIVEGNLDPFLDENNAQAGIVKDILVIQNIINSYDPESGLSFGEHSSSIKQGFQDNGENSNVFKMLEALEGYDKINSVILARVMNENVPELEMIDIGEWPQSRAIDIVHQSLVDALDSMIAKLEMAEDEIPKRKTTIPEGYQTGAYLFDGATDPTLDYNSSLDGVNGLLISGDLALGTILIGDMVFNTDGYNPSDKESDASLFIAISRIESTESPILLLATINEKGKMVLVEVNKDNRKDVFGYVFNITMGRYDLEERAWP